MLRGVEELADAVQVTMGPKVYTFFKTFFRSKFNRTPLCIVNCLFLLPPRQYLM